MWLKQQKFFAGVADQSQRNYEQDIIRNLAMKMLRNRIVSNMMEWIADIFAHLKCS